MNISKRYMRILIILEELMLFAFSIYLFSTLNYAWWIFIALLFAPDISMLGYLINTKIGAIIYNVIHHRLLSILLYLLGVLTTMPILMLMGVILLSHQTLDRVMGFGLKYSDDFKHTHLSEKTSSSY